MSSSSKRCRFESRENAQCKALAQRSSEFCFFHDPKVSAERTAARRAGGIARTRPIVLPKAPKRDLRTAGDVVELLAETINNVRCGELDVRVSNAIGYLSGVLLAAIEKSDYEKRLTTLEAVVSSSQNRTESILDQVVAFDFELKNSAEQGHSDD